MKTNILQQNIKRTVAGLLAVWLSGVMFLFCCEATRAKMSEAESCPLAKKNHCHKQSNGEAFSIEAENQMLDCCRFPSQVFDKVRKIEANYQAAKTVDKIIIAPPKYTFAASDFVSAKVYQSVVQNRGSTYLKNCVFRI